MEKQIQDIEENLKFKVELEEPKSWQRKLNVEVPIERIKQEIEDVYLDYNRKAKIPGFRKGKIPREILKLHFGEEIEKEAIERLIPKVYSEILKAKGIAPITDAKLGELTRDENQSLKFSLSFEIMPKIELVNYKGLKLTKKLKRIGSSEVKKTLHFLQESKATLIPVEREAKIGDHLIVNLVRETDKKGKSDEKKAKIVLGEEGVLQEFNDGLRGAKIGDEREIKVNYPQDYFEKELAGKNITYHIRVEEIKEKILPEINDEFAKEVGKFESLRELEDKITEEIIKKNEQNAISGLREEALNILIERSLFEVPDSIVERYLDAIVEDLKFRMKPEEFDEKKIRQENKDFAVWKIKRMLIVEEIAKQEKIETTDEDIEKRIEVIANLNNKTVEEMRRILAMRKELRRLSSEIIEEKVLDLVVKYAKIEIEVE